MPAPHYRYRANKVLKWLEHHKITFALAPPRVVYIELASVCNLKCSFCPTGIGKVGRPPGFMKWETFRLIVDDVASGYPESFFHMWGESLLHPEFNRFAHYAKSKGFINIVVNTNGNIKQDALWFREMVASGIDTLQVDVDGADQAVYTQYRHAGNVELIFDFLEKIQQAKQEMGSETPHIIPLIVVNQFNKEQIPEIRARLERIGISDIKLRNIKNFIDTTKSSEAYEAFNASEDGYGGIMLLKKNGTIEKCTPTTKNQVLACPSFWSYLHITSQGAYVPCCQSYKQEDIINSIDKIHPMNFWYSKQMRHIRKLNIEKPWEIPVCRECEFIHRRSEQ